MVPFAMGQPATSKSRNQSVLSLAQYHRLQVAHAILTQGGRHPTRYHHVTEVTIKNESNPRVILPSDVLPVRSVPWFPHLPVPNSYRRAWARPACLSSLTRPYPTSRRGCSKRRSYGGRHITNTFKRPLAKSFARRRYPFDSPPALDRILFTSCFGTHRTMPCPFAHKHSARHQGFLPKPCFTRVFYPIEALTVSPLFTAQLWRWTLPCPGGISATYGYPGTSLTPTTSPLRPPENASWKWIFPPQEFTAVPKTSQQQRAAPACLVPVTAAVGDSPLSRQRLARRV